MSTKISITFWINVICQPYSVLLVHSLSKWEPGLNCTEYVTDRMWFVSSFLKKIWQLILMKSRTSAFTFLDIHVIFKFRLVIRSSNALETCPHTPINCSKLSISYKYIQKAFEWKLNLNKTLKIIFST